MKHIFLNLKRFDVPVENDGVNRLATIAHWGTTIVERIQNELVAYDPSDVEFVVYFPEAHLLSAAAALKPNGRIRLGCQSVYRSDTEKGGNFGAFTSNRPASVAVALGCESVLIGHCEERDDKMGVLAEAFVTGYDASRAVNRLMNAEIRAATTRGLRVLYCVGEKSDEQERWQEVISEQISAGLAGVDKDKVDIAYEPLWAIGPGKKAAGKDYITKIARFIKAHTGGMDVVYGGGLKSENASMLASINEIDGGLIALTRFSGEIGFYPDEYISIVRTYLGQ